MISGIQGQDSQLWLANNLNPGREFALIAWIHSHVQGMHCCFSSIDIHTQYAQQIIYEGSFGIVVEIKRDSTVGKYDAYKVTDEGAAHVWDCNDKNRGSPLARKQHQSCSGPSFYKSI